MELNEDSWPLVKGTPGSPDSSARAGARAAHPARGGPPAAPRGRQKVATKAQFSIGESVKVVSGPLSDFSGEISEVQQDASKLKVLVSIFGRETPVEVGFDQVKKI
jgi:transcriptional antiterminator NusG